MPLVDVRLPPCDVALPRDVRRFLQEADRRIEIYQQPARTPAFVPSDFPRVYGVLQRVADSSLAPGTRFCEWGSGFGVVAGLAAMLGFEAWGIEIEEDLVDAARQLAQDFDLPVEFVHGSFIPRGGGDLVDAAGVSAWLNPLEGGAYEEIELDPDDFDVVFAYPWPDEEFVISDLFDRFASTGAILVTYHGIDDLRTQRKLRPRTRRKRVS